MTYPLHSVGNESVTVAVCNDTRQSHARHHREVQVKTLLAVWVAPIDAWSNWLAAQGFPATTIELRTYHMTRFAREMGSVTPWQVTLDDLTEWFGVRHSDWGQNTRRSFRSSIRVFYRWGLQTKRCAEDPTLFLPAPRPRRSPPKPTSEHVIRKVLRDADERVVLMVLLAATCSMRRGEITRMHTDWIEHDNVRIPGKGGHTRLVPLPSNVAEILDRVPRGYVFPRPGTDKPMTPAHVGKLISQALGPTSTAHGLRHRFATRAYEPERDLIAVQELMGHANIETTRIYTAAPDGARRRAAAGTHIWAA